MLLVSTLIISWLIFVQLILIDFLFKFLILFLLHLIALHFLIALILLLYSLITKHTYNLNYEVSLRSNYLVFLKAADHLHTQINGHLKSFEDLVKRNQLQMLYFHLHNFFCVHMCRCKHFVICFYEILSKVLLVIVLVL